MKTRHKTHSHSDRTEAKSMTLGDLIASTYLACGQAAPKILQLAIESKVVRFTHSPAH